ncbi:MarR family winged helix-turn-helix transcriptional regulator [Caproiciproducens sp. MSJ-32]|uniref:MarR family winged helix-turn-helix transcriptional regulator n=1 Tax=Caproiciproducens sp. MSJ-32 TaxID=2841527 RepID=UPI001C0F5BE3|nr:winged helix-turn-helix transcriptional regulator [Caproiciproducens sp. MSJ-32]MBU5454221.1 winged helix-turn-helix transcriptional regulator [Caproiciproducens sp. MSJ-32]
MIETDLAMKFKKIHQRVMQLMQKKIDKYGLSTGLLHIALIIEKNPDISQKDIAKELRVTEGAISTSIKKLLNLKILDQIPLEEDMRYNKLVLTELGKSIIDDYRDHLPNIYKEMFNGFNQEDLLKLSNFLYKINKNLDNMNK